LNIYGDAAVPAPVVAPVDPNAAPVVDPNAIVADPNAPVTPVNPNAPVVDPNAPVVDPNAAPAVDPNAPAGARRLALSPSIPVTFGIGRKYLLNGDFAIDSTIT